MRAYLIVGVVALGLFNPGRLVVRLLLRLR